VVEQGCYPGIIFTCEQPAQHKISLLYNFINKNTKNTAK